MITDMLTTPCTVTNMCIVSTPTAIPIIRNRMDLLPRMTGTRRLIRHEMHGDGNAHGHHGTAQLRDTHIDGHSEADCESECLSCTNHCSSLAILSQPNESENGSMALASSPSHCLSSLAEKLLRPPILV